VLISDRIDGISSRLRQVAEQSSTEAAEVKAHATALRDAEELMRAAHVSLGDVNAREFVTLLLLLRVPPSAIRVVLSWPAFHHGGSPGAGGSNNVPGLPGGTTAGGALPAGVSDSYLTFLKPTEGTGPNVTGTAPNRWFKWYTDSGGVLTIGFGHQVLPSEHDRFQNGISEADATALLRADVTGAADAVRLLVKVPLTQSQFDALVDFTFNCGSAALAKTGILQAVNAGNLSTVPDLLRRSYLHDAAGHLEPGLVTRRAAEANMFANGVY
jgi:lysozyme